MLKNKTNKPQTLLVTLAISFIAVIIAFVLGGWELGILVAIAMAIVLYFGRYVWMSNRYNFLLRSAVLGIVSLVVVSSHSFWHDLFQALLRNYWPDLNLPDYTASPITLFFLLILVTIVFYYTQSKTTFAETEKPIKDLIEGPTIKQKWENVCRGLEAQIRDIDRDTNWSSEYYTPLEAEVEMRTSTGTKRVVKDLLDAIKQSDDRLFLMIGDPGSGKSVSLRKLCLDILKDSVKTEYIPIYVNLKEWVTSDGWNKKPPTWQDLEKFVKRSLEDKDRHLADFFERHYKTLDENGNLFFVLDSFDEIPQVLETTAESKLIEDLTKVCREFLVGAKQPRSRGILASREYRMPRSDYLEANTALRVRPFTFEKIRHTLTQSGKVKDETVTDLFRERRDLIPILRNPFIASLLYNYLIENNGGFPKNQAELYSDYVEKSIIKAQKRLGREYLDMADIMEVAKQMAVIIFSESGMQAPIGELRKKVPHDKFDEIVELLKYTRIIRGDSSGATIISFAHRRFYEYFVVQDILSDGVLKLPLESIPTDSKWRDTLVLYCEVAPFEEAKRIANYCWFDVVAKNPNIQHRHSKHCLRFLSEAYKGRQECLEDFKDKLAEFVLGQIDKENDPISIKLVVECLGILDEKDIDEGAIKAFKLGDSWINDTALRSCRHLEYISDNLEIELLNTLDPVGDEFFFKNESKFHMESNELIFSLSLSEAFNKYLPMVKYHQIIKKIDDWSIKIGWFVGVWTPFVFFREDVGFLGYLFYLIASIILGVLSVYLIGKFVNIMVSVFWFWNTQFRSYRISVIKNSFFRIAILLLSCLIVIPILSLIEGVEIYNVSVQTLLGIVSYIWIGLMIFKFLRKNLKLFFGARKLYFGVDKNELSNREYIQSIYMRLDDLGGFYLRDFINLLESQTKEVHGNFSNTFLKVGNNPKMTRLLRLEEKWRENEERQAQLREAKEKGEDI